VPSTPLAPVEPPKEEKKEDKLMVVIQRGGHQRITSAKDCLERRRGDRGSQSRRAAVLEPAQKAKAKIGNLINGYMCALSNQRLCRRRICHAPISFEE
jgi:hypothetical protein